MELVRETWSTIRDSSAGRRVGLLPIGSVENHGLHLPLGTDLLTAEHIARGAANSEHVMLLPAIPVGLSHEHRQFPGTLWVSRRTLTRYVLEIVRSAASHGLYRTVLVNGHGGNWDALVDACRTLRAEGIYAFVFQWWSAIHSTIQQICVDSPDHAGDMETSVMLCIDSQMVHRDRIAESETGGTSGWGRSVHGVPVSFDTIDFTRSGSTGRPSAATPAKGEQLLNAAVSKLTAFILWLLEQEDEMLAARPRVT